MRATVEGEPVTEVKCLYHGCGRTDAELNRLVEHWGSEWLQDHATGQVTRRWPFPDHHSAFAAAHRLKNHPAVTRVFIDGNPFC